MIINRSEIDPTLILNMSEYEYIGLKYILLNDIIYLYPSTIISIIGSILNIFCVIVYFKKQFNSSMFFYFKVLSVCYLIQNLTGVPYSYCNALRFQINATRKICSYYATSYIAFGSLLTYYESILEIAILLDRLRTFNETLKKYLTLTPQKFSMILFVICFLIDLFYMFVFTPEEFVWYNYKDDGTLETKIVWDVVASTIASSNIGRIFIILTYVVREFVTIMFTLVFSLFLLNYMKSYFKNKVRLVKKASVALALSNESRTLQQTSSSKQMSDQIRAKKTTSLSKTRSTVLQINSIQQQLLAKQMNNSEEKFLQLVIVQCTLTILTRSNFFMCCFMALFNFNALTQIWCAIADFSILFTSSVSFFIYFFFNRLFKKEFLKLFNINSV